MNVIDLAGLGGDCKSTGCDNENFDYSQMDRAIVDLKQEEINLLASEMTVSWSSYSGSF